MRGHIGGTLNLCLLTAGGPTNCKQYFLLGSILGLYFLCRSQALTCLPPPNMVIFTLRVVITELQVFEVVIGGSGNP